MGAEDSSFSWIKNLFSMTLTPKLHDVPRKSLKLLLLLALWPHYWGAHHRCLLSASIPSNSPHRSDTAAEALT